MEDFQIPEGEETLCCEFEYEENQVLCKLEECKRELMTSNEYDVLCNYFPVFRYIVRNALQLPASILELCWKIVLHELKHLTNALVECDFLKLNHNKKKALKVSMKVLCYVSIHLGKSFECESIHDARAKGKKVTCGSFSWEDEKLMLMVVLVRLCSLELMYLWETPSSALMEDLSALFASLCYKLLENPLVVRDKRLLETISELVGLILKKYGLTLSVSLKLIQLLQHFDHLVNPVSSIVVAAVAKHSCKQVVLDIYREICSMDPSSLALDSSGAKSFASFLVLVSGQIPSAVLPAVPVLLPHLSGESTTFRSGVLGVLGELLKSLSGSDVESDMLPDTRDEMLLKVMEHLHDINAFVRVKVLNILLQLCSAQAIPLPLLQGLLEKVAERLKDKSSLVRKAALQLLGAMLSSNPFGAQLDKEDLTRKLREEEKVLEDEDETVGHKAITQYLQAALNFTNAMACCIPTAVEMLKSKVASDVLEALEFLSVCHLFGVDGAEKAISKSLPLVWAEDERLHKAVVSTHVQLYLNCSTCSDDPKQVVKNLIKLTTSATLGELASLEKLVGLLVKSGHVPAHAIDDLWQIYRLSSDEKLRADAIQACQLLSMIIPAASTAGSTVSTNLNRMLSIGLVQLNDLLLAKHVCCAIKKFAMLDPGLRLPCTSAVFSQIMTLLLKNFRNMETSQWVPLCENGLSVVYQLSEQPNSLAETLLQDLTQLFKLEDEVSSVLLSRLLFCAGHVAQCQVLHCELHIAQERKKMPNLNSMSTSKSELEEELGVTGDDQDAEFIRKVMETEVGGTGLLAHFQPLIVGVVSNPNKFSCEQLQTAAATALSKFMLISSAICSKYLQLFFTVLEKAKFSAVRANLIIAASDLVCRFPNTIEPWTPFLYNRLKDSCGLVRKNTIMVLTHLILNDMIKIRGQVSSMALCLEDCDSCIQELSQVFFYELSLKGNSLYNVLPDIISQLTDPDSDACSQTSFRNIVRHLFLHMKKEKHHESLIEKLCHRLRAVRTEQQARSLAYCLSLFVPTEKGMQKLYENFSCYKEKLLDDVILNYIQIYLNKAKKIVKAEIKGQCEELEKWIIEATQNSDESETSISQ